MPAIRSVNVKAGANAATAFVSASTRHASVMKALHTKSSPGSSAASDSKALGANKNESVNGDKAIQDVGTDIGSGTDTGLGGSKLNREKERREVPETPPDDFQKEALASQSEDRPWIALRDELYRRPGCDNPSKAERDGNKRIEDNVPGHGHGLSRAEKEEMYQRWVRLDQPRPQAYDGKAHGPMFKGYYAPEGEGPLFWKAASDADSKRKGK